MDLVVAIDITDSDYIDISNGSSSDSWTASNRTQRTLMMGGTGNGIGMDCKGGIIWRWKAANKSD